MPVTFYNCLVFQPNRDVNSLEYINLLKLRGHLQYLYHPAGGGRVSYVYIKASRLRHQYFGVDVDDDISQGSIAAGPSPPPRQRFGLGESLHTESCDEVSSRNAPSRFIVLYSHGNAEDLGTCYSTLKWFAFTMNIDLVCYDYRGYGFSGHRDQPLGSFAPSEETVFQDADAMYSHLLDKGYHPSQIIIMGRSLGGGAACHLAEQHHREIAGLILESCFSSCLSVVSTALSVLGCLDQFINLKRMRNITGCPVLFLHGESDQVVPFRCSVELMRAAIKARQHTFHQLQKVWGRCGGEDSPHWAGEVDAKQRRSRTASHSPVGIGSMHTEHEVVSSGSQLSHHAAAEQANLCPESHTHEEQKREQAAPSDAAAAATMHSLTPVSPASPHTAANSTAAYEAFLAEGGLRCYAGGVRWGYTEEERNLGLFHQWFEGCGHNDVEKRLSSLYAATITRFLSFVARTAPLPPSLSPASPSEEESAVSVPALREDGVTGSFDEMPRMGESTHAYVGDLQQRVTMDEV